MASLMSEPEWRAFLSEGTRTGKLATTQADGRPHVVPIWFLLDADGSLVFTTEATSAKGRALARDPRAALCVDDDLPPFSFVAVEGTVTLSRDLDELRVWATRIAGRYMGADLAESYGRRNATPGEYLVRLHLSKVRAIRNIAE
jgi:PPOX class probable F420-dependent enzyme